MLLMVNTFLNFWFNFFFKLIFLLGDSGLCAWGIDGESGELVDMNVKGIWEPLSVKLQVYKTAVETAILLLRIDDIVSGSKKSGGGEGATPSQMGGGMAGME